MAMRCADVGGHLTYLALTRVNQSLVEERWAEVAFWAVSEILCVEPLSWVIQRAAGWWPFLFLVKDATG